ncbi:MAG TPA: hypothetical protein VGC97_05545 [Pyrinomonadaceae bacterium]|jgi:hypothetical protein
MKKQTGLHTGIRFSAILTVIIIITGAAFSAFAQYDKPAKSGMDGAVCLEFTGFQMGAPQQWRPENDPRRKGEKI